MELQEVWLHIDRRSLFIRIEKTKPSLAGEEKLELNSMREADVKVSLKIQVKSDRDVARSLVKALSPDVSKGEAVKIRTDGEGLSITAEGTNMHDCRRLIRHYLTLLSMAEETIRVVSK
ncbi:MAG: hypothetical protein QXV32_03440 [Conexivisphaerales archaeon]